MGKDTFSGRVAIVNGWRLARRLALPTLPYYIIAALIISGLYLTNTYTLSSESVEWLISIIEIALSCMVAVIFYSLTVEGGNPTRKLLRDTNHLFLATLLVYLCYLIVMFIMGLFLVLFAGILLASSGFDPSVFQDEENITFEKLFIQNNEIVSLIASPSGVVLAILLCVASAGLVWLAARLVLYGVATVVSGRIRIFQTWSWTKGSAFGIIWSGAVIVGLPILCLLTVYVVIPTETWVLGRPLWQSRLIDFVLTYILSWPVFLLGHGYAVAVYKQLCPELLDVEEAFG